MKHFFHRAAEVEHLGAVAYYNSRQPGLGEVYLREAEAAIARICEAPHRHALELAPNIRRYRLHKFPYTILFRVTPHGVELLALSHHRQRPSYWVPRI